jgi:A/G-specific adenine glycosylase
MLKEAKHLSNNSSRWERLPKQGFDSVHFRADLSDWYRDRGRIDLPWRQTRDPYSILVSEFMLQQTPVTTVTPRYEAWLCRFPNFESVAYAPEDDVLHAWQGLGYYSRARRLHATAKIVTTKYRGQLPREINQISALPGIGRYTANAIACFAFDQPVPLVDANIARVVARLLNIRRPIDTAAGQKTVWAGASLLLPTIRACDYNSALMDLGAVVCIARRPKCGSCPVRRFCRARTPDALPRKKSRPSLLRLVENHCLHFCRNRVLLEKSSKRWRGMWILPHLGSIRHNQKPLHISEFPFTHHRVTLAIYAQNKRPPLKAGKRKFFSRTALEKIPIPSPHRRALMQLLVAS